MTLAGVPRPHPSCCGPSPRLCPFPTVLSRLNSTSLIAPGYTGAFVYPYSPFLCHVDLKRSPGFVLFFQAGLYWGLYPGSIPGSGRSPGGGNGNPLVFLPGEFHGQRDLVGYSLWDPEESDTTEQLILSLLFPGNSKGDGEQSKQQFPLLSGMLWGAVVVSLFLILSEGSRGVSRGQAGRLA